MTDENENAAYWPPPLRQRTRSVEEIVAEAMSAEPRPSWRDDLMGSDEMVNAYWRRGAYMASRRVETLAPGAAQALLHRVRSSGVASTL